MNQQLPQPIRQYLEELELNLKQRIGVVPENALADAREFLLRDMSALHACEPGMNVEQYIHHFHSVYGKPAAVADAYEDNGKTSRKLPGYAPGWRICCTSCGRSAPAAKVGITRTGAFSFHKYVLGWCHDCRWLRPMRLQKDLEQTNLTDALGMLRSPEELRKSAHKPWLINSIWAALLVAPLLFVAIFALNSITSHTVASENTDHSLSNLPSGWQLTKQIEITPRQLSSFSQKLGGTLVYANNSFIADEKGVTLQVNELRGSDSTAAQKIYAKLSQLKGGSKSLILNDDTVFEFVFRTVDQGRLAAKAKYQLALQPAKVRYKVRLELTPIAKGDAMQWNKLFNACIKNKSESVSPNDSSEFKTLSQSFQWGNRLNLRTVGVGAAESRWQIAGEKKTLTANHDITLNYEIPNARDDSMPTVELVGIIECHNLGMLPAMQNDSATNYLASSAAWPSDAPDVQVLAQSIVGEAVSPQAKINKILSWITNGENLSVGGQTGSRYGTRQVLTQKFGNCWDYSDVFITLCRACKVPARQVFGWLAGQEGHVWCEVQVDSTWRHVDPTSGTGCGSDYIPFFTSKQGELPPLYTQMPLIEVLSSGD